MNRCRRLLAHTCASAQSSDGLYPSSQISIMRTDDDDDPSILHETRMRIDAVKYYRIMHLDHVLRRSLARYAYDGGMCRSRYSDEHQDTSSLPVHDDEEEVILLDIARRDDAHHARALVRGGMRPYTVWRKNEVVAAVCTCGGLCPGLNDVTRELVCTLYYQFGVDTVYGIRNGLHGFYDTEGVGRDSWTPLRIPDDVQTIHTRGGTFLGSSRGHFDADRILNACLEHGVNQVYITGGDGTHRAAYALSQRIHRRRLKITIVAIPKTIDNDIGLLDRSFGFNTAVERAQEAIESAHVESSCTPNGVGVVKLMGRQSGFIACHATMASRLVDICLIPEVPFSMTKVLAFIERVLRARGHVVIVIAEGAAKHVVDPNLDAANIARDESGNILLPDIGEYFQQRLRTYFAQDDRPSISLKFHDPSYMIRSCPADASDAVYCLTLAQNAVFGAMAGYTAFSSCVVNNRSVYVPLQLIDRTSPVRVNPTGRTWMRVLSSTHQPAFI